MREAFLYRIKKLPISKKIEILQQEGELIHVQDENFSFVIEDFPLLYDSSDQIVIPVTNWFFHLKIDLQHKSIHATANAMLFYWRFLEKQSLSWDQFGYARNEKPTYIFHDAIQNAANEGLISKSTASSYMNYVIGFYKWAMLHKLFDFNELKAPFRYKHQTIKSIKSATRASHRIVIETTDLAIKAPRAQKGAKLRRLEREELKQLGQALLAEPKSFRLIVYLALSTGMREEEICTLKEYQVDVWFQLRVETEKTSIEIPIGPGSSGVNREGNKTKGDKLRRIEMPLWLLDEFCQYKESTEHHSRKERFKTKYPNSLDEIPLFLTQTGNAFSTNTLRTLWCEFRARLSQIIQHPFTYKFHDLRATYASYTLMRLRSIFQGHDHKAIEVLKSWMGHENDKTLWVYITLLDADVATRAISLARENELEKYLNIEGEV